MPDYIGSDVFFPVDFWPPDFWPEQGGGGPVSITMEPDYIWSTGFFPVDFWPVDFWPIFGTEAPSEEEPPSSTPAASIAPRRSLGLSHFELWLTTDTGQRLSQLSTGLGFNASKVVNGIGWFHYNPPKSFDKSLLRSDRMVQVWYTPRGATLGKLWNVYFIRKWKLRGQGVEYFAGPDINELLRRRIVAAFTGSTQAKKEAMEADNMMKEAVTESLLNTAPPIPDYGSRAWANLSIQAAQTLGPQISDSFAFKKLLTFEGGGLLPAIAKAAQVGGTEIFFWIVPDVVTKSSISFQFQTYINQPGQDMTGKVIFEEAAQNLANAALEFDYSDEATYIYGTGQGEEAGRVVRQVYDTTRINQSIWGRIEAEADSRDQATPEGVIASAGVALWDGRPRRRFTGTPLDSPGAPFGTKWDVGYKVTTKFDVIQFDSIIRAVTLSIDGKGRKTIDSRLDYED